MVTQNQGRDKTFLRKLKKTLAVLKNILIFAKKLIETRAGVFPQNIKNDKKMKKAQANAIAKHLEEVAKNVTDATAFVVKVYENGKSWTVELLPDYSRRRHFSRAMATFHHLREVVTIENYYNVLACVSAEKAIFEGREYESFRVMIF